MSDDLFDMADDGSGELPKDQWGRYKLPDPETGQVSGRTRATTFAKSVADTYVLSQWQMRMALKGMTMRPDLAALIAATPLDDRDRLNQLAEDCKEAAAARAAANLGTAVHAFNEQTDANGRIPDTAPANLRPILAARQRALADHQIVLVPEMIERTVYVPEFDVVGTFDRWGFVEVPDGDPGRIGPDDLGEIIDDKTGRDLTYGWNEIVIQLALYANATHILNKAVFWEDWRRLTEGLRAGTAPKRMPTRCWEPMPPTRKDRGVVIHMPVKAALDAPTAPPVVTLYKVDLAAGWEAAWLCHKVRQWRKRRELAKPLSVTVPAKDAPRVDLAAERMAKGGQLNNVHPDMVRTDGPPRVKDLGPPAPGLLDTKTGFLVEVLEEADKSVAADQFTSRTPNWQERIRGASSVADLSQIWREASAKGEWTKKLEDLGKDQMSKFRTI